MNERINQLLNQAYDEAVPETWTELSSEQLGRIYDKFAELIVKECADICYNREYTDGSRYGDEIIEHFGVK